MNEQALKGPFPSHKPITLQQAAFEAGVSPDTIARWCKKYGIGKQLHPKAPWRVDLEGLAIVMAGDAEALAGYQKRTLRSENQHERLQL